MTATLPVFIYEMGAFSEEWVAAKNEQDAVSFWKWLTGEYVEAVKMPPEITDRLMFRNEHGGSHSFTTELEILISEDTQFPHYFASVNA